MDVYLFLILAHTIGAVLGVGGATLAEVLLVKALKDGSMDPLESNLMHGVYSVVRVGFVISLMSGFSFLILYKINGQTGQIWSPVLWAKMTVVFFIGLNAILLQARAIPLKLGSAVSFVSWYTALFLGVFIRDLSAGYFSIIFVYLIALILGIFALDAIRRLYGIHI